MNIEDIENTGLNLLKKGQKGIIHAIFSRLGLFLVLLLLQVFFLFAMFRQFANFLPHILGGTALFTIIMVLYLLNTNLDPTAKISWLIAISLVPVFGALLFWYTISDVGHRALRKRYEELVSTTKDKIPQSQETIENLSLDDLGEASIANYLHHNGGFPVFNQTDVTYFPLGEDKFVKLLKELEQAKHFIFLEYFIIDEGLMWGRVLEILAKKAKEGVDVRVMYDGTCEFSLLPHDYPNRLKALGIRCKMFAPLSPVLSTHYNYRDHRKILVIDGHTAFNGGVNLADEYINHIKKYGHWKDTAVMIKGEAVKSFTLMFLQMWNIDEREPEFDRFLEIPTVSSNVSGYVIPYGDCPLDNHRVGERIYMDILNRAQKYVHIMSPYLILDGEMEAAIKFAAERGVDVTLILPGIPDKKAPFALAKTHYASLMESGVSIYEYTPGFVHAKVFVCDDCKAVVGTINLDYRSLYHHFECATYLYKVDCISKIEEDFQNTQKKCRKVSKETIWFGKKYLKPLGFVMKTIAPLL